MKICLLGDTHFGVRNDNPSFHAFFSKFYKEVFFPYLKENQIDHIIQLGDLFDRRKYINFNTLSQCRKYFIEELDANFKTWVIVGNHDTYYKNTNQVNSVDLLLGEYANINKVNDPVELTLDNVKFLLLPWICEDNRDVCYKALQNSNADVVIGHFEINGFEMHRGAFCEEGVDRSIFNKFEQVYSGHFHHKSTSGNICYVGTPYEMMWSDYDDPKGFHIYDTQTRELTFIRNPFNLFHKIHYDDLDKQISDVMAIDFNHYTNTFVKVIVRNKTNPYCFDMFIEKLEKAGVNDLQVVDDHFHMDVESEQDIISEAEDTITILTKFVRQLDDSVDKKRLENLMTSLYTEALSVE